MVSPFVRLDRQVVEGRLGMNLGLGGRLKFSVSLTPDAASTVILLGTGPPRFWVTE